MATGPTSKTRCEVQLSRGRGGICHYNLLVVALIIISCCTRISLWLDVLLTRVPLILKVLYFIVDAKLGGAKLSNLLVSWPCNVMSWVDRCSNTSDSFQTNRATSMTTSVPLLVPTIAICNAFFSTSCVVRKMKNDISTHQVVFRTLS